jgi:hypothetical protein
MVNAGFVTSQPDDDHIFNYFILLIKTQTIKLLDNLKAKNPVTITMPLHFPAK